MADQTDAPLVIRINHAIWKTDLRGEPLWRRAGIFAARLTYSIGRDATSGSLGLHATGLVYTTLLSLVPLLALSFSVLKGFGVHNQIEPLLYELLAPLGEKSREVTTRLIDFVDNMQVGVLGTLGLAVLVYTVISLMQKIERAFNEVWHVSRSRSIARRFSDFLSMILLGPVLLFTALGVGATVMNNEYVAHLETIEPFGWLIEFAARGTPFVIIVAAFSFIYGFIPNTRVRAKSALVGGLIAGALWVAAGWVFASFVANSGNYTAIYSAFATIIVFMIWLFVAWLILLTGASIAFYVQHPEYLSPTDEPRKLSIQQTERLALAAVLRIGSAYYAGNPPPSIDILGRQLNMPTVVLGDILKSLERASIISRTGDTTPGYLPARPFETTPVMQVMDAVRKAGEDDLGSGPGVQLDPAVARIEHRIGRALDDALADQSLKDFALENRDDVIEVDRNDSEASLEAVSVVDARYP